MGDPIENPDVYWITKDHHHIPINERTGEVAFRKAPQALSDVWPSGRPLTPRERGLRTPKVEEWKRLLAAKVQEKVARLVGGEVIPDNDAFDVELPHDVIEVKALIEAKYDRLPGGKSHILIKEQSEMGKRHWTIGWDMRGPKLGYPREARVYLFPGNGGFRIGRRVLPIPRDVIRDLFAELSKTPGKLRLYKGN